LASILITPESGLGGAIGATASEPPEPPPQPVSNAIPGTTTKARIDNLTASLLFFVETVHRVYGQTSLIDLCQTFTGPMKKPAGLGIAGSFIVLRFSWPYKA
jgi:hypothetical protein